MAELFLLSRTQMRRIEPFFPRSRGLPRVDDRRVISGIVYVIRHGLQWRDAPGGYGPHKTLYNRFVRWSRLGVFERILAALVAEAGEPDRLMIDATLRLGLRLPRSRGQFGGMRATARSGLPPFPLRRSSVTGIPGLSAGVPGYTSPRCS